MNQTTNIKRNVVIYTIGVLSLATLGGIVTATGNEIGGLIFIISPISMMVLLRFFAGDGWQDAGLAPKLKENWRWYLFGLFAYPVTIVIVIGLGEILGVTKVNGNINTLLPIFAIGFATQLIPRMLFAMFEEWGWRGYMEPRLVALNVPDLRRHLFVGLVWAVWHFPLIFSTDYTEIHFGIFLPIFVIGVVITAIVYGQLRKESGTVWTCVLMHGIGNAVLWSIVLNDLITFNDKVLANPAPEGILMIVLWGALAWWMLHRKGLTLRRSTLS